MLTRFLKTSRTVVNATKHLSLSDVQIEALALGPNYVAWSTAAREKLERSILASGVAPTTTAADTASANTTTPAAAAALPDVASKTNSTINTCTPPVAVVNENRQPSVALFKIPAQPVIVPTKRVVPSVVVQSHDDNNNDNDVVVVDRDKSDSSRQLLQNRRRRRQRRRRLRKPRANGIVPIVVGVKTPLTKAKKRRSLAQIACCYACPRVDKWLSDVNTALHFQDPRRDRPWQLPPTTAAAATTTMKNHSSVCYVYDVNRRDRRPPTGHMAATTTGGGFPAGFPVAGACVPHGSEGKWHAAPDSRAWTSDPDNNRLLTKLTKVLDTSCGLGFEAQRNDGGVGSNNNNNNVYFDDSSVVRAMHSLRRDPSIKLCLSDKGCSSVVWCKQAYIAEARRHLHDASRYDPLSKVEYLDLLDSAVGERTRLAEELVSSNHITTAEWVSITEATPRAAWVRFRPKLHKPLDGFSGTFAGRPVVNTSESVTRGLDQYLSAIVSPLTSKIPFCCKSTEQVVDRLRSVNACLSDWQRTNPETKLELTVRTADVVSLYPSVLWEQGVAACVSFYAEWFPWLEGLYAAENKLPPPPPDVFGRLLNFVTRNSLLYLHETDSFFHQTSGVAMGSCVSGFIANCYVWQYMRAACDEHELRWNVDCGVNECPDDPLAVKSNLSALLHRNSHPDEIDNDRNSRIIFMCRYVDDFIAIDASVVSKKPNQNHKSSSTPSAFERLLARVTQDSPHSGNLVFTTNQATTQTDRSSARSNITTSSIPFLDLNVNHLTHQPTGFQEIRFCPKTNPKCNYLHYNSRHPRHVVRALPYGQLVRLFRNASSTEAFLRAARKLARVMKLSGYPRSLLRRSIVRVLDRFGPKNPQNQKQKTSSSSILETDSVYNPETNRMHCVSHNNNKTGRGRLFRFVTHYDGGSQKHWRFVKKMLDGLLAGAASFYARQGPGGDKMASLLERSRAAVTLRVDRPLSRL